MPLPMPKSWTDLHAKFEDHAYFFILTSRQALRASWVLEQRHEQMPHFRQEDRMRAWRDYLEHWDKPDSSARLGGLHPARTGLRTTKPKETTTTCFDLLAPVLDGAHQRGIGVVLGTPTYAASPWLARRYPEIAGEPSTGQPVPWGGRQEIDKPFGVEVATPKGSFARSFPACRPSRSDWIPGRQRAGHAVVPRPRRLSTRPSPP